MNSSFPAPTPTDILYIGCPCTLSDHAPLSKLGKNAMISSLPSPCEVPGPHQYLIRGQVPQALHY
jgi:hypothetical protein